MPQEHPEFPWPHLEFVEWGSLPGSRASAEAAAHREAFAAACPDAYVAGVPGFTPDATIMRRALERRNSRLDLGAWMRLWTAEDRAGVPLEERQRRVRADLGRVEALPFRADPELASLYREAARILKDATLMERLRARVQKEAPNSSLHVALTRDAWHAANPRPKYAPTPEFQRAIREYEPQRIAFEREILNRRPGDAAALLELWLPISSAAHQGDPAAASDENLAIADQMLRQGETAPDRRSELPPRELDVARLYVVGKVRLDQVPKLLDAADARLEKSLKYELSAELLPAEMRSRAADWRAIAGQQLQRVRAGYLLAVNRPGDARALAEAALAQLEKPQDTRRAPFERQEWTRILAQIDAREGRVEEALAHYQASLAGTRKENLESQPARVAPIKAYYLAHGGTEKAWPDWATSGQADGPPPAPRPLEFTTALAGFNAADLRGRTWQLRDLHGKVTLVNYWATWCGPCRGEHPALQELYDAIKGRKDLLLLTVSVDESPSAVREYIKEKGYTFPVLHAPELADKLFPWAGLPTNFLVNAQGMRSGMVGVADKDSTLKRMESSK
jgi:thiol-disulfide isomerase/thioredoxin